MEQSLDRLKWYERILRLSQRVTTESLESICQYLMDDAIAAGNAEAGYFFLIDETGKPHIQLARTGQREDLPKENQHYSETILKRSIEMAAPMIVDDASSHPDFGHVKSVIAGQLKSVLVLPLYFEKKTIGAIYLENKNQKAYFSPELLEFLTLFSTQAAVLLHTKISQGAISRSKEKAQEQGLSSKSAKMQEITSQAESVAETESNVLITGETGTGKEVLARYIHARSPRAKKNFVAINCSAIPETLLESELFGYKKGAFTGAVADRQGLVKKADGGTMFLDEVGDLPLHMQSKLLRVLQEKRFHPVGSNTDEKSDFRLLSATHRSLEDSVSQGLFRQDLFFRINTVTFKLPALRDRPEDVLDLAQYFLEQAVEENLKSVQGFDESAAAALMNYDWPGNIRELQNAVQRATVLKKGGSGPNFLTEADFAFLKEDNSSNSPSELPRLSDAKEQFIRNYVKKAILVHKGNKTKAAKALGVDPKTLYRHLGED